MMGSRELDWRAIAEDMATFDDAVARIIEARPEPRASSAPT